MRADDKHVSTRLFDDPRDLAGPTAESENALRFISFSL